LFDGFLVWRREGISIHDNGLAVMNHVTLFKTPLAEIFMTTAIVAGTDSGYDGCYDSESVPTAMGGA